MVDGGSLALRLTLLFWICSTVLEGLKDLWFCLPKFVVVTCWCWQDPRFDDEVDRITGYHTESLLCMAVRNAHDEVIAVAQVINKSPDYDCGYFTAKDEKVRGGRRGEAKWEMNIKYWVEGRRCEEYIWGGEKERKRWNNKEVGQRRWDEKVERGVKKKWSPSLLFTPSLSIFFQTKLDKEYGKRRWERRVKKK